MVNIVDDTEQIQVTVYQPGQIEDLTTYTFVPGLYLSVAPSTRVNFTGLPKNVQPPVYLQSTPRVLNDFELKYHLHVSEMQDYPDGGQGVNYLGGSVYCLFTRRADVITWQDMMCVNGVGNLGDGLGMGVRSLWVGAEAQPKHIYSVYNYDTGICPNPPPGTDRYEFVYWQGEPNTAPAFDFYVRLVKTGSTITEWLYSDPAMTQLFLNYQGTPFPESGRVINNINLSPYTYFIACAIRETGSTSDMLSTTGYMDDFQIVI